MRKVTQDDVDKLLQAPEFDPEWYRRTYPDVGLSGVDPAWHYLRYGVRMWRDPGPDFPAAFMRVAYRMEDRHEPLSRLRFLRRKYDGYLPPPDPRYVLMAAHEVARRGNPQRAVALAEAHLSPELGFTAEVLRANAALASGDEAGWQRALNGYLGHYGMAGVRLAEGPGTIFDRLLPAPTPEITGGPLVSVIMPAWNAEKTLRKAAGSILAQSWRNLELLIVDDASPDGTWAVMQEIAAADSRVRILRNTANVGPYVSKNLALLQARGDLITGMDADEWSLPDRIARQMAHIRDRTETLCGCVFSCIRTFDTGGVTFISQASEKRPDAVLTLHPITLMLPRRFMLDALGSWDSARFGADTELIKRAAFLMDGALHNVFVPSMLYIDAPGSLTNHPETAFNVERGMSPLRRAYRETWLAWQAEEMDLTNAYCMFPPHERRYHVPEGAAVPLADILTTLPEPTRDPIRDKDTQP